jgi:hypothetical protein
VADAIGAILRGAREGDDHVRRRAYSGLAKLIGILGSGGLAVIIAYEAWGLSKDAIRRTWAKSDEQQLALVHALERQSVSIDNLVWTLWEKSENSTAEHTAIMRKLGVQAPRPVQRPSTTVATPAASPASEPPRPWQSNAQPEPVNGG